MGDTEEVIRAILDLVQIEEGLLPGAPSWAKQAELLLNSHKE